MSVHFWGLATWLNACNQEVWFWKFVLQSMIERECPYTWLYKSSHQKTLDLCVGNALLIVLYESFKQFALGQAPVNSTIHSPHGKSHIHNDPPHTFCYVFSVSIICPYMTNRQIFGHNALCLVGDLWY